MLIAMKGKKTMSACAILMLVLYLTTNVTASSSGGAVLAQASKPTHASSLWRGSKLRRLARKFYIDKPLSEEEAAALGTLRALYNPDTATAVDTMNSVEQTWDSLDDFGRVIVNYNHASLIARSLTAGVFVGFGGILSASVGFDMGKPAWEPGNGLQRFFCGAIGFPLSIILVSLTGNGAWTGDMLLVARAYFSTNNSPRLPLFAVLRTAVLTWVGSLMGAFLMALLATGSKLPAVAACHSIAAHKLEGGALETFLRGVGGGKIIE